MKIRTQILHLFVEIIKQVLGLNHQLYIFRFLIKIFARDPVILKENLRLAIRLRDHKFGKECAEQLLTLESDDRYFVLLWYLNFTKSWFDPRYDFQSISAPEIRDPRIIKDYIYTCVQMHGVAQATRMFKTLVQTRHAQRFLHSFFYDVVAKTEALNQCIDSVSDNSIEEANKAYLRQIMAQAKNRTHLSLPSISRDPDSKFDLVYTWIGSTAGIANLQPAYGQASFADYHRSNERYANNWEIVYSIWSFSRFCKNHVNNIHIVSNEKFETELLPDEFRNRIYFIPHKDIFPDYVKTPSYNSNVIEFFLHRIPGLSDKFVYANDDMLLYSPTGYEYFFMDDGRGISYFRPSHKIRRWFPRLPWKQAYIDPTMWHQNTRQVFRRVFDDESDFVPIHQLMALRKEIGILMEERFAVYLRDFFQNRFRSNTDIKSIMLMDWIEVYLGILTRGNFQKIQDESLMFAHGFNEYSVEAIKTLEPKFLCANIDEFNRNHFWNLMDERLGETISSHLPS